MPYLKLFGTPLVSDAEGPLSGPVAQNRQIGLLSLLAVAPDHMLSRDKAMALLWPERPTKKARNSLNVSVHVIRKALGPSMLVSVGSDLRLADEEITCDVWEFEKALAMGALERAVDRYDGSFLDGFHLDDAVQFAHWADRERTRLARGYAQALEALAEGAEQSGDFTGAVEWWTRRSAEDPLSARIVLRLMEVLAAAGNRAAAVRRARNHAELLKKELGVEPNPDVEGLAEHLRREAPHVETPGGGPFKVGARHPDAATAERAEDPTAPNGWKSSSDPPSPEVGRPRTRPWKVDLSRGPAAAGVGLLFLGALTYLGAVSAPGGGAERDVPEIRSVAVLPLESLAPDPEAERYFADGMTEELTAELGRTSTLNVISRTSSMGYRGTDKTLPEIARELGVDALIEGSVFQAGGEVRITVQLVHGPTDRHLWSESYERDFRDVLALQTEVARAVAEQVQAALTPQEEARLARKPVNPDAYTLWLKGNYHRKRMDEQSNLRALQFFQDALEIDPSYARAHAGVASAYVGLGSFFGHQAPDDALRKARSAAGRALALDSTVAEAHYALALIRFRFDWDWEGAERAYRRTISLDPTMANAYASYAHFLDVVGRPDEAVEVNKRAIEIDPLYPPAYFGLGTSLVLLGRDREAMDAYREGFEVAPNHFQGQQLLAEFHYARIGEFDEALSHLERNAAYEGMPWHLGVFGYCLAAAGDRSEALNILSRLMEQRTTPSPPAVPVAFVHMGLGNHDEALRWLETAYEERDVGLIWLKEHWIFEPLHGDPRYEALVERMGFPAG